MSLYSYSVFPQIATSGCSLYPLTWLYFLQSNVLLWSGYIHFTVTYITACVYLFRHCPINSQCVIGLPGIVQADVYFRGKHRYLIRGCLNPCPLSSSLRWNLIKKRVKLFPSILTFCKVYCI